ncbi:hypothetical protein JW905_18660 [bacterium]|nr:hypothetical protein [candidate division CSSED10-310 bacterium]
MNTLKSLLDTFRTHTLGFTLDEVMSGSMEYMAGAGSPGKQPFDFTVQWGPDSLTAWLNPRDDGFLTQEMTGTITAGDLAEAAPCRGTLELRYFRDRSIRYSFTFTANGIEYRYLGEKVNIRWWNLPFSHTTCFGVITESETNRLVARTVSYFRLRTMPWFLTSFRLRRKHIIPT